MTSCTGAFDDDLPEDDELHEDEFEGERFEHSEISRLAQSGRFAMSANAYAALRSGALGPSAAAQRTTAAGSFGRISTLVSGVLRVPVVGLLVPHEGSLTQRYNATAYESILRDVTAAMQSPKVRAVLLSVNSGGGYIDGCGETATGLRALRGTKPLHAHVRGDGCSAAYWVAAACDAISADPTSLLGGLGVQMAYLDMSGYYDAQGVEEIIITSSQTPMKNADPAEPAGRAAAQRMVDDLAAVMFNSIAPARGISVKALLEANQQGIVLVGERARAHGLIDRIGFEGDELAQLARPMTQVIAGRQSAAQSSAPASGVNEGAERILAAIRKFNPGALITSRQSPTHRH